MTMKLTFKEYLESKEQLKMALDGIPKVKEIYEITKYCSVPVKINEDIEYLKFKPRDIIEIMWEKEIDNDVPKSFTVLGEDQSNEFSWSNAKVRSWVRKMTRSI